jgi:hypothetical protein
MALPILDGNQSPTTLSTIIVSNAHIPAHTVVSLGTQAKTDILSAVSSGIAISGTVTANVPYVNIQPDNQTQAIPVVLITDEGKSVFDVGQSIRASIQGAIPAGTNRIGVVTIGGGTVTIGTGTAQIGSVTASISGTPSVTFGTVVITGSTSIIGTPSVTFTQIATHGVTIASGTAQIGSVTASISGTPSVTFTTATITGSTSILNFPATQTVTFTTATVTGSTSILNFPTTQTVTFTQITTHGVTIANTSVTVNGTFYQATQPVSLTTLPSLVAGTAQIGSVTASISGTPSVTFTQIATHGVTLTSTTVTVSSMPAISGTVTANAGSGFPAVIYSGILQYIDTEGSIPVAIDPLPAGTNRIGVVTVGNSVTIGSLPAISGTVTANLSSANLYDQGILDGGDNLKVGLYSINGNGAPAWLADGGGNVPISGTVTANIAISSSVITSGSFTSLTSATLVPANTARKMATVYNLGAGQLYINAGANASTLGGGFMVALSSGDFYECDYTTTTLSAIFATAGTASWMSH